MMLSNFRYSLLRYYHYVDSDDQELGTLEDLVIDKISQEPTFLLLGGGFFEEYLESKGDLDDIDELAPINCVSEIEGDFIILSEKLENMQTTTKKGELPVEGYKFTSLMMYHVYDSSGVIECELFDLLLDGKNSRYLFSFPNLTYKLVSEGFRQRFDISVPLAKLTIGNEKLTISTTEDELLNLIRQKIEPKLKGRSQIEI